MRRRLALWCAVTALALLSHPLYMMISGAPALEWISEHPWPLGILLAAATVASVRLARTAAWEPELRRVTAVASAGAVVGAALSFGYVLVLSALPASTAPAVGTRPPHISVALPEGRGWELSEAYARGPVLLVFYRGHW